MKKVLLLIDSLCSGGAQRQLVGLAVLLKEYGYNVCIVDYWDIDFYDKYLHEKGVRFDHCVAKGKLNIIREIRLAIKRERPNVVISYMEHPSIIACLIKISHTTHPFHLIVSERNTSQANGRSEKVRFNLFRCADFVIPNSHSQKKFIKTNFPLPSDRTVTITNYIDVNRFSPSESFDGIHNDELKVVMVGRVVEQKNPLRFLKAISIVKNKNPHLKFKVDWYGEPYPESYFQECLSLKKSLGLDDIVEFHPPTSDVVSVYRNSDIFILPSIYEGFPNVLCEAMSCGLPVLASNVCDNPNIVADGENGLLFNPLSIDDMAEAISSMLTLPRQKLEEMGKKSRRIALEQFSETQFLDSYISLIEKV